MSQTLREGLEIQVGADGFPHYFRTVDLGRVYNINKKDVTAWKVYNIMVRNPPTYRGWERFGEPLFMPGILALLFLGAIVADEWVHKEAKSFVVLLLTILACAVWGGVTLYIRRQYQKKNQNLRAEFYTHRGRERNEILSRCNIQLDTEPVLCLDTDPPCFLVK